MFLRDRERRDRSSDSCLGITVTVPSGKRYFFPGATDQLGMALAQRAIPSEINHPHTHIEFGEAIGASWSIIRVVKSSDQ